jgi:large subunit ribosomal protein L22
MTNHKHDTKEHEAIARATAIPISTKFAIEICNNIRGQRLERAIAMLEDVVSMKRPLTFYRFTWDLSHKAGAKGPGRFPVSASKAFIELLKLARANAENLGLNSDNLVVYFAKADFGPQRWHYGRQRRTRIKMTHVELRVREATENLKSNKKVQAKAEVKTEAKKTKVEKK